MRSLFRRILGDRELLGDLATGDWSPVPAGVSAQALDVEALLATDVPLPRCAAQDWEPICEEASDAGSLPLFKAPEPRADAVRSSRPAPCIPERAASPRFTPEELAIIEEQRRAAAAPKVPTAPEPAPEAAPRQSWVDVLKSFGESLTDSELQIIRRQLAT